VRDLHIVLGRGETCADSADDLAIDHNRKGALHVDDITCGDRGEASLIDGFLQRLARLLQCGCSGLARANSTPARQRIAMPPRRTRYRDQHHLAFRTRREKCSGRALFHFGAGELDHLLPFLGLGRDQRAEGVRRADQRFAAEFDQALLDIWFGQHRVDLAV
jgi:hypothetical protein